MLDIGFGAAFIAGLLSFIAPCVLPIVPPSLAYLAGVSFSDLQKSELDRGRALHVIFVALVFVLGFTTVFVALGATASVIGKTVASSFGVLSIVAGAIIVIMGLHFLGVFRIGLLYREARVNVRNKPAGFLGAYLMGLAFAFGWTPCVGPILATILFVAGSEDTAWRGAALLGAYSLGLGLPFLVAAVFINWFIGWSNRFKRHLGAVEKVMGAMLVVAGILIMTGQMSRIAQWLLDTFPAFATVG